MFVFLAAAAFVCCAAASLRVTHDSSLKQKPSPKNTKKQPGVDWPEALLHHSAAAVVMQQGSSLAPPRPLFSGLRDLGAVLVRAREDEDVVAPLAVEPGQHVGEMSLIERAPRSATVRSKTAMSVLVIERDAFFGLLSEEQTAVKLLWGLVRMLNARLRSTSDELSHIKARNQGN